eukprot:2114828-Amphidinium_carterae.1
MERYKPYLALPPQAKQQTAKVYKQYTFGPLGASSIAWSIVRDAEVANRIQEITRTSNEFRSMIVASGNLYVINCRIPCFASVLQSIPMLCFAWSQSLGGGCTDYYRRSCCLLVRCKGKCRLVQQGFCQVCSHLNKNCLETAHTHNFAQTNKSQLEIAPKLCTLSFKYLTSQRKAMEVLPLPNNVCLIQRIPHRFKQSIDISRLCKLSAPSECMTISGESVAMAIQPCRIG